MSGVVRTETNELVVAEDDVEDEELGCTDCKLKVGKIILEEWIVEIQVQLKTFVPVKGKIYSSKGTRRETYIFLDCKSRQ